MTLQYISEFGFTEPFENERKTLAQIKEDVGRTSKYAADPCFPILTWTLFRLLHDLPRRDSAGDSRGWAAHRGYLCLG